MLKKQYSAFSAVVHPVTFLKFSHTPSMHSSNTARTLACWPTTTVQRAVQQTLIAFSQIPPEDEFCTTQVSVAGLIDHTQQSKCFHLLVILDCLDGLCAVTIQLAFGDRREKLIVVPQAGSTNGTSWHIYKFQHETTLEAYLE